jgi:transcription elongation factor Elf1
MFNAYFVGASRPAVTRERIIKHARRRTRSYAKQENEPVLVTVEPDTVTTKHDNTPKSGSQLTNATDDVKLDVPKAGEVQPVYIETEATVDYGRCVVEPSYGEKPDRKKLRTGKREKVKTKGQANKHLMAKKENRDFETMIDEYLAEIDDYEEFVDKVETADEKEETENATTPSPAVMNAVDQPQVLDDREFHLVPDEIKRVDVSYYDTVD